MFKTMIAAALLSLVMAAGGAWAQTPSPSPPAPSASDKKAISKACSDQANAKGLHGTERKKFRSECKKDGGKLRGA
jgi:hypothetical protein